MLSTCQYNIYRFDEDSNCQQWLKNVLGYAIAFSQDSNGTGFWNTLFVKGPPDFLLGHLIADRAEISWHAVVNIYTYI